VTLLEIANPKSAIFGIPFESKMFAGFISLWWITWKFTLIIIYIWISFLWMLKANY